MNIKKEIENQLKNANEKVDNATNKVKLDGIILVSMVNKYEGEAAMLLLGETTIEKVEAAKKSAYDAGNNFEKSQKDLDEAKKELKLIVKVARMFGLWFFTILK